MVRAVFLSDPDHLRHQMEFSNWQLDVDAPADAFTTSSAASAKRFPFAHPHPETTAVKKPLGKGTTPASHK